jgi:serine/threonine-protein kinase
VEGLPRIGDDFAGCRLESMLGQGGMGAVYRATELSLQRTVAVKVIAPDLAASIDFRARFLREAQVAAALEHPHVVPVYSTGEDGGRPYIVMRLVPGRDAGSWSPTRGVWSLRLQPKSSPR